jgi:hypothetical protein
MGRGFLLRSGVKARAVRAGNTEIVGQTSDFLDGLVRPQ